MSGGNSDLKKKTKYLLVIIDLVYFVYIILNFVLYLSIIFHSDNLTSTQN